MPNRIIKESIWTSPNLNKLSDLAERHFYRILPLPDDHGCFEATPDVVKGQCYPKKQNVTEEDIDTWQDELQQAGMILRWSVNGGRQYAVIAKFSQHQIIRSLHRRKTPEPPKEIQNILDKQEDNTCKQLPAEEENAVVKKIKPSKEALEIWQKALGELQMQVSKANYRSWLEKSQGLSYFERQFVVGVPTSFVADYLNKNQRSLIEKALSSILENDISVKFTVSNMLK